MTKKLLYGTIGGGIASYIAGFLIYALALSSYFQANQAGGFSKENPDMLLMAVGCIIFAFLVTYIFVKWAGISTLSGGFQAGFIIGILFSLGNIVFMFASTNVWTSVTPGIVDAVAGGIVWAIGGAGAGWALGMVKE